jgi:hypothetical protein
MKTTSVIGIYPVPRGWIEEDWGGYEGDGSLNEARLPSGP